MPDAKHEAFILLSMNISQVHTVRINRSIAISFALISDKKTFQSTPNIIYPDSDDTTDDTDGTAVTLIVSSAVMTESMFLSMMTESMFLSIHACLNASV